MKHASGSVLDLRERSTHSRALAAVFGGKLQERGSFAEILDGKAVLVGADALEIYRWAALNASTASSRYLVEDAGNQRQAK